MKIKTFLNLVTKQNITKKKTLKKIKINLKRTNQTLAV